MGRNEELTGGADAVDLPAKAEASHDTEIHRFLERLPVGAVQVRDGQLMMNSAAERLIGYSNADITTLQAWFDTLYGPTSREFLVKYELHRLRGFPSPKRGRIKRGDGEERLLQFRACGNVAGEVWIVDDITERVAAEKELLEAKRLAEAANLAKSQFLANMSHEIRTPLNGILTMAEVMAHGELTNEQRESLTIVRRSGEDLLHLLNDILDFSKIEAGKLNLEETIFDPLQVLESTLALFAPLAAKKGLYLDIEIELDFRGLRRGDPIRFRQVIANLMSNSLKFTEKGGIRVRVEGVGESLQISVHDTGLGIPADRIRLLFKKFSQVDASTTRRFGGTGLGLAISQELAVLMGGTVWAESVEGQGSVFYSTFRLPYAHDTMAEVDAHSSLDDIAESPLALRVLAAEDNPNNQVVLSKVMEVFGFELTLVGDGAKAVEAWRTQPFDVILMDVQMPVMDGVQATRAIRMEEAKRSRARTPIIALSANSFCHQVREYLNAGMDAHVAKPIELNSLRAALENVLNAEDQD